MVEDFVRPACATSFLEEGVEADPRLPSPENQKKVSGAGARDGAPEVGPSSSSCIAVFQEIKCPYPLLQIYQALIRC